MAMNELLVNHLPEGPSDMEAPFCPECGQLLGGRTRELTWKGAGHPWWAWGLIALGAALTFTFGLAALQSAREQAATQEILRGLPAWEARLEGPSLRYAALRSEGPPGIVDRHLAAENHLNRALVDAAFALAMVVLGIGLLARRSAQRRSEGRMSPNGADISPLLLDSVRHTLLGGSALAETVALSGFRLLTVTFLYLLIARMVAVEPPTLSVVQETLDRLIQIVAQLPDLVH